MNTYPYNLDSLFSLNEIYNKINEFTSFSMSKYVIISNYHDGGNTKIQGFGTLENAVNESLNNELNRCNNDPSRKSDGFSCKTPYLSFSEPDDNFKYCEIIFEKSLEFCKRYYIISKDNIDISRKNVEEIITKFDNELKITNERERGWCGTCG